MIIKSFIIKGFIMGLCVTAHTSLQAQTNASSSIVTYDVSYFKDFKLVTLRDMLLRIPGLSTIVNNAGSNRSRSTPERGFSSSGDQILINGKRISGKNISISDSLGRIAASQVLKIEVIRGAVSGLDVQSDGLVINILLKEGQGESTTFWKSKLRYNGKDRFFADFLLSHSGSVGRLEYNVTGELKNKPKNEIRTERRFTTPGILDTAGDMRKLQNSRTYEGATSLLYGFENGDQLQLNLSYEKGRKRVNQRTDYSYFDASEGGGLRAPWHQDINTDNDFENWEIGGDYGTDLGGIGRLKILFIVNRNTEDNYNITTPNEQDDLTPYLRISDVVNQEKIIRGSVLNNISERHTLEIGVEAAINTLDLVSYGGDELIADGRVKENRYDVFVIYNYTLSDQMTVQSSLNTEFSRIGYIGQNLNETRAFTYFKPRIDVRYDVTQYDQLRFTVEKKVSQLDFDLFFPNWDQNIREFKAGNPNIRPEKKWRYQATYEKRLGEDGGSIQMIGYYENRHDFINEIDSSGASGNIKEPAKGFGAEIKGDFRLGFVGIPEAVLTLEYQWNDVKFIDAFLKEERRLNWQAEHNFIARFRHDVSVWDFSYGFYYRRQSTRGELSYYEDWVARSGDRGSVFMEKSVGQGYKVKVNLNRIEGTRFNTDRYSYNSGVAAGDVTARQSRITKQTTLVTISLEGNF